MAPELPPLHALILGALARTYGFDLWRFENEAEFKHELFHQLAVCKVDGLPLNAQVDGTPSCRLHAEGKVENGNPSKADLLICDPVRRQGFNYHVDYILELKSKFTRRLLADEVSKFTAYQREREAVYLISDRLSGALHLGVVPLPRRAYVLDRSSVPNIRTEAGPSGELTLPQAVAIIEAVISDVLWAYGNGSTQYHGFFWCNYEHEQWRKHGFPCEGDFVAHLYHRLRCRLPDGVELRSEVHPPDENTRVDLVVRDRGGRWCIPIDVKMNWDQFKPKYKDGVSTTPEAELILQRFRGLRATCPSAQPFVVVIQWEWRLPRDIRRVALPMLEQADFPLQVMGFDEARRSIVTATYG